MFVFRVLNDEIDKDVLNKGINAKVRIPGGEQVLEALRLVNRHIQNGSEKDTCWISVSKNFLSDVEIYNMPIKGFNELRHDIAVIGGYDTTEVVFKMYYAVSHDLTNIAAQNLFGIEKLVLDFSSDERVKDLQKRGLHYKLDGTRKVGYARARAYGEKSSELLIYDNIPKENIKKILNPLETDILYALIKEYGMNDINIIGFINKLANEIEEIIESVPFTRQERILFDSFYNKRMHLLGVACEFLDQNKCRSKVVTRQSENCIDLPSNGDVIIFNNDDIDVLNVFAYLKNKKRSIISKILAELGFSLDNAPITEDVISIVRIGTVNQPSVERLFYRGEQFFVPCQSYETVIGEYKTFDKTSAGILYGKTDLKEENMYWLNEANRIERKKHWTNPDTLSESVEKGSLRLINRERPTKK